MYIIKVVLLGEETLARKPTTLRISIAGENDMVLGSKHYFVTLLQNFLPIVVHKDFGR